MKRSETADYTGDAIFMKKNLVPLLGIAFVVALIATGIFYGLFVGKLRGAGDSPRYAVVVAAKPLVRGAVVQAADVKVYPWTGPQAPKGAFVDADQVVGFTVLEPIGENEPVSESRLASHRSIPAGMRGISIHVTDSSGIVPMLRPGNKVDVQVVSNGNGGEVGLRTILQNVEVLTTAIPENNRPVVNLLVTPLDAELVGLADSAARIRLVLRNPADDGRSVQTTLPVSNLMRRSASEQVSPVSAPKDGARKISAVLVPR
jgi:Flp pilus assembly protein CpaB